MNETKASAPIDAAKVELMAKTEEQLSFLEYLNLFRIEDTLLHEVRTYRESISEIHAALSHIVPIPDLPLEMPSGDPVNGCLASRLKMHVEILGITNECLMILRKALITITRKA